MHIYVYYKLIPDEYPNLIDRIRTMQARIASHFALHDMQCLKRPQADEQGRQTWMEVYHLDLNEYRLSRQVDLSDQALAAEFIAQLNQLALEQGAPHPRANEVFEAIESTSNTQTT